MIEKIENGRRHDHQVEDGASGTVEEFIPEALSGDSEHHGRGQKPGQSQKKTDVPVDEEGETAAAHAGNR